MALHVVKTFKELIASAKEGEDDNDLEKASKLYEQALKQEPLNENVYIRLMIIYRKQTEYEKELKLINKGIKAFEEFNKKKIQKIVGKDQKAIRLSNALAKSLGLKDKRGNELYHPEPIAKWIKRREIVEKKLGKTNSK
ncbi:MAG: hypothetical protein ABR502_08450 [Chitinophagaceae bacterium]